MENTELLDKLYLTSPAALAEHVTRQTPGRYVYTRARHLDILNDHLVRLALGEIKRLLVIMPRRHGKSATCSEWFPTWYLSLFPTHQVGLASYESEFAAEWGQKVRDHLSQNYDSLGIRVKDDSKARNKWTTHEGGGMMTTSIGGPMVGRGFQLLNLDDPTKNADEAESTVVQDNNWRWWKSTFRPTLEPGGSILVIGTQWSLNDLIARLLKAYAEGPGAEGYENWTILRMPAICDEPETDLLGRQAGEPLWPERWPKPELEALEASVGPYNWAAQYQGHPVAAGGGLLKHRWWRYWVPKGQLALFAPVEIEGVLCPVVELPETFDQMLQSWDMNFRDSIRAVVKGHEPDAVAGHVYGRKGADKFMLDRYCQRVGLNETIHAVRVMSKDWPEVKIKLYEHTANGPAVAATLQHEVGGFIPITPEGAKVSRVIGAGNTQAAKDGRATTFQADVQAGNWYLPHPALKAWVAEVRENFGFFPQAGKDDTDAASQAWAWMAANEMREENMAHSEAKLYKGPPPQTTHEIIRRIREAAFNQGRARGMRRMEQAYMVAQRRRLNGN